MHNLVRIVKRQYLKTQIVSSLEICRCVNQGCQSRHKSFNIITSNSEKGDNDDASKVVNREIIMGKYRRSSLDQGSPSRCKFQYIARRISHRLT